MASGASKQKSQEHAYKILVRRAGPSSSEDLHQAVFDTEPEPRTLEEMNEGIRTHFKKRHARLT